MLYMSSSSHLWRGAAIGCPYSTRAPWLALRLRRLLCCATLQVYCPPCYSQSLLPTLFQISYCVSYLASIEPPVVLSLSFHDGRVRRETSWAFYLWLYDLQSVFGGLFRSTLSPQWHIEFLYAWCTPPTTRGWAPACQGRTVLHRAKRYQSVLLALGLNDIDLWLVTFQLRPTHFWGHVCLCGLHPLLLW